MPGGPMRTPHMRMAARILEAYEFKLLSTQVTRCSLSLYRLA